MPREIVQKKFSYRLTVGRAFFCLIKNKYSDSIEYDNTVIEVPTIKTLVISRDIADLDIFGSGELLEAVFRVNFANIALTAVSLQRALLNMITGATSIDGATFRRTNDIEREFAFGYQSENNDGSFNFYWHPTCKLTPTDETYATRTNDIPDPESSYNLRVVPYNNLLVTEFSSSDAKNYGITTPDKRTFAKTFFLNPIYNEQQFQELISEYRTDAVGASIEISSLETTKTTKKDDNK